MEYESILLTEYSTTKRLVCALYSSCTSYMLMYYLANFLHLEKFAEHGKVLDEFFLSTAGMLLKLTIARVLTAHFISFSLRIFPKLAL